MSPIFLKRFCNNKNCRLNNHFSELIEEVDNFFDVEWQEKILLVEIIAFVILIITAGKFEFVFALWRHHLLRSTASSLMSHQ